MSRIKVKLVHCFGGGSSGIIACKISLTFALCLSCLPLMSVAHELNSVSGSVTVQEAFKAFRDGEKQRALELFNKAAREEPDSIDAHFGRARVLHELGRKEEAIKEYKLVLLLEPDKKIIRACRDQLSYLGVKKDELPQLSQPGSAPASIKPQDVEGSISKILKQSEDRIKNVQSGSQSYANNIYNSRSDAHNKAMEKAKEEIEEMRRTRIRFGTGLIPAFSDYDMRLRQAELQFRSMRALDRAKSDYENRKKDAEARSMAIKESAEGLESQMINKPSETSGVFLVPEGTNLYVRNYAHFDPVLPEPPEPLLAVPLKMPQLLKQEELSRSKESANARTRSQNLKSAP